MYEDFHILVIFPLISVHFSIYFYFNLLRHPFSVSPFYFLFQFFISSSSVTSIPLFSPYILLFFLLFRSLFPLLCFFFSLFPSIYFLSLFFCLSLSIDTCSCIHENVFVSCRHTS